MMGQGGGMDMGGGMGMGGGMNLMNMSASGMGMKRGYDGDGMEPSKFSRRY